MLSKRILVRNQTVAALKQWDIENPDLVQDIHTVRPASFVATPIVYVGAIRFTHESQGGLMYSTGELEVVVVGSAIDNKEGVIEAEAIADSLVTYFAEHPHFVDPNTVAEPTGSESTDLSVGEAAYHGVTVTIGNVLVVEGHES